MKAVVIGATGAVGYEVVNELLISKAWSSIAIISRRKLTDWENLPMTDCNIKFIIVESLDILNNPKEKLLDISKDLDFEGYDCVFNLLGGRVKMGEMEFRKVDYHYVVYSAELCLKFNIKNFVHVSSQGGDPSSCLLYLRVKGEVEEKLKTMSIQNLSIFKPGLIKNRRDERCGEKFSKYLSYIFCCIPAIEVKDLAYAVVKIGEGKDESKKVYSNSEIKFIVKENKKKDN